MRSGEESGQGGRFSIGLEFSAECCPGCGEPREPGLCPRCGVEVGESVEVAEMAVARGKALKDLSSELDALLARFEEMPEGNIPLSNDQFATAVSDTALFGQIGEMAGIGSALASLDLNDRGVIGRDLRALMAERIGKVEALAETCEELSLFDPSGPAAELRVVAVDSGRYGARLTRVFLEILVAPTIPSARDAEAEMNELLGGFPYAGRTEELAAEIGEWMEPDFDARAALVLGRPGRYSDEQGFLDLAAVFGAFVEDGDPQAELAACGRRYFAHLIDERPIGEDILAGILVIPAIGLATLDRPLAAHRIARASYRLLCEAAGASAAETQRLAEHVIGEGELIWEAIEQIRRGLVLLTAGEEAEVVDEGGVLKTVMDGYRDISETSFRTYGRLILDLGRIRRGEELGPLGDPPTLGNLTEALAASPEPAAKMMAAASDPALRNASAHSQYRWQREGEEVLDLRTGQRWSIEELEASLAAMSGAIAGVDAAYACFLVAGETRIEAPGWVADVPTLGAQVARLAFVLAGFEVLDVDPGGLWLTIEDGDEIDPLRLMSTLGGITVLARPGDAVRVEGSSGRTLADVEVVTFREASSAGPSFEDLAILAPFLSSSLRTGTEPQRALREVVTVMANQVLLTALPDAPAGGRLRDADRCGYVLSFARRQDIKPDAELTGLLKILSRCRAAAFAAAREEPDGIGRLAQELLALNELVTTSGIAWPPNPINAR